MKPGLTVGDSLFRRCRGTPLVRVVKKCLIIIFTSHSCNRWSDHVVLHQKGTILFKAVHSSLWNRHLSLLPIATLIVSPTIGGRLSIRRLRGIVMAKLDWNGLQVA